MIITILAYLADAAILGTYALMVQGHSQRWFHWANALGGPPLLAVEIVTKAWPVLPITAVFSTLAWVGIARRS